MCSIKNNRTGIVMYRLACLYIVIPMVIFLCGWVKWWIFIPGICIIGYSLFQLVKAVPYRVSPSFLENKAVWVATLMIIAFWVYLSGVGRLTFQNADHHWRNTIFNLLVTKKWPVVESVQTESGNAVFGLVYYIGFWLPSALIGKLFGLNAGYCFQAIWAMLGIFLFYYLLCTMLNKVAVWPLIVFVLFSGLDVVGDYLLGGANLANGYTGHLEWWAAMMQFSSNTTLLFWVFNQAIPIWLILMIIIYQDNNRKLVFLASFSLMTSTLPFIGLVPIILYKGIRNNWKRSRPVLINIKETLTDTLTIENILGGGFVGILSFLYLRENTAGQNIGFIIPSSFRPYLMRYLLFLILEVFLYMIAIYRYQKQRALYWILIPLFMFFPVFHVGYAYDFGMRASIPALTILCILVIDTLTEAMKKKDRLITAILIVMIVTGSVTPLHEMCRTFFYTVRDEGIGVEVSEEEVMGESNFSCNIEKSFFFNQLASD